MLLRILTKSLARRRSRIAIAVVAVVIGAAVATALMSVSLDVNDKVSREFSRYGANLMVVPRSDTIDVGFPGVQLGSVTEQAYINESDIWRIKTIYWRNNVLGFAPFLYQVVGASATDGGDERDVVMAGTYFDKQVVIPEPYSPDDPQVIKTGVQQINSWWTVEGSWIDDPLDSQSAMVGSTVAVRLGLDIGDTIHVTYRPIVGAEGNVTKRAFTIVGTIHNDGTEDNQIFINLHVAQEMTSRENKIHTVQVSALCTACPVETFAEEIEAKIPSVEGRTVKQLVNAQMETLNMVEGLMLMVTAVGLLASALGVTTTMTASVIERRKEIALMKAVGAGRRQVVGLFMSEAAIIGVLGGFAGYIAGVFLAQVIGLEVFDTAIALHLVVLPAVLVIGVAVALLASLLPVRRAVNIEPAIVLRGE